MTPAPRSWPGRCTCRCWSGADLLAAPHLGAALARTRFDAVAFDRWRRAAAAEMAALLAAAGVVPSPRLAALAGDPRLAAPAGDPRLAALAGDPRLAAPAEGTAPDRETDGQNGGV